MLVLRRIAITLLATTLCLTGAMAFPAAADTSTGSRSTPSPTHDPGAAPHADPGSDQGAAAEPAPEPEPEPEPGPTPVATRLTLTGPRSVVDERTVTLTATWRTTESSPRAVPATVTLQQRVKGTWRAAGSARTNGSGAAGFRVAPRADATYRVVGPAGATAQVSWQAATSATRLLDNVPPGAVLRLPGPAPRRLPAQARAKGAGANAVVSRIDARTWRSMVGRSWHRGCPVGRAGLRLVSVNYWGYDGYRHRGQVVLATGVAKRAAAALSQMHAERLPIRAMYRVDRFGWSKRLGGADDYASMASGNTSGFNCRDVVGRPGIRSPHARGRSIDINTWENPYYSRQDGWVPNGWWVGRTHPKVAWRSSNHPVVRIWRKHGFRWTYGTSDAHHYDGRRVPTTTGSFSG